MDSNQKNFDDIVKNTSDFEAIDNQTLTWLMDLLGCNLLRTKALIQHNKAYLWLLFRNPSPIHFYGYKSHFSELITSGVLNKEEFIISSFSSVNYNLNPATVTFFFGILEQVKLTPNEILKHQLLIFKSLASDYPKIYLKSLTWIKQVANHDDFDWENFMEIAPQISTNNISHFNVLLILIDKYHKSYPKKSNFNVSMGILFPALGLNNSSLQLKILKFIKKYGDIQSISLQKQVKEYYSFLLSKSKDFYHTLFNTKDEEKQLHTDLKVENNYVLICKENEIMPIVDVDDFLFLLIKSKGNILFINRLLYSLPLLHQKLVNNDIIKLNSTLNSLKSQEVDGHLSLFLRTYCLYLSSKFQQHIEWEVNTNYSGLQKPIIDILSHLIDIIKSEKDILPLSAPSHKEIWLDPNILIERILEHENNNIIIEVSDFQSALFRLPHHQLNSENRAKIEEIKSLELKQVLNYIFDIEPFKIPENAATDLWVSAILSKNNPDDLDKIGQLLPNEYVQKLIHYKWHFKESKFENIWEKVTDDVFLVLENFEHFKPYNLIRLDPYEYKFDRICIKYESLIQSKIKGTLFDNFF